ncbi:hypothetical protein HY623_02615 [Candidatus Uhrbacteria bacterium]|nr:hypothetical protein [Candidatus Uhrbacteria bacterium]
MTQRERNIVIGCVLGDGFIQRVGTKSARLRLEHSLQQKDYLLWKVSELRRFMQKPSILTRFHPTWKKFYYSIRCQSHSSSEFGKLRMIFYQDHAKQIPESISRLLKDSLVLAVWYMDDGYYYKRDKTAYIYLSKHTDRDTRRLLRAIQENFDLHPKLEKKKNGSMNLKFSVAETKKLSTIIAPHMIQSMRYKIDEEPRID